MFNLFPCLPTGCKYFIFLFKNRGSFRLRIQLTRGWRAVQLNMSATPADQISKLSSKQILTGLANSDCGKGLGICRTAQTSGKGWNSHGSVSCHSYGCGVNYAVAPGAGLAHAFY